MTTPAHADALHTVRTLATSAVQHGQHNTVTIQGSYLIALCDMVEQLVVARASAQQQAEEFEEDCRAIGAERDELLRRVGPVEGFEEQARRWEAEARAKSQELSDLQSCVDEICREMGITATTLRMSEIRRTALDWREERNRVKEECVRLQRELDEVRESLALSSADRAHYTRRFFEHEAVLRKIRLALGEGRS